MAIGAPIQILADALFFMLGTHVVRGVLMATIAGVARVVMADMASHALDVVIPIQLEVLGMVKRGRLPVLLAVALAASTLDVLVKAVLRRNVATLAPILDVGPKQIMRKMLVTAPQQPGPLVITVAGHAIILDQALMECGLGRLAHQRLAFAGAHTDVCRLVTNHAPLR